MIKTFNGHTPRVDPSAFVSEAAYVVGDVEIGEGANIWPGAVIRGDIAKITVGSGVSIEDHCVVHSAQPLTIGAQTIVGHGAVLHCRRIGSHVLIGNHATLLDEAEIGDHCVVGAGALVPPGMKVPPGSLLMGVPGRIKGQVTPAHQETIRAGGAFNRALAGQYKKQGF